MRKYVNDYGHRREVGMEKFGIFGVLCVAVAYGVYLYLFIQIGFFILDYGILALWDGGKAGL